MCGGGSPKRNSNYVATVFLDLQQLLPSNYSLFVFATLRNLEKGVVLAEVANQIEEEHTRQSEQLRNH